MIFGNIVTSVAQENEMEVLFAEETKIMRSFGFLDGLESYTPNTELSGIDVQNIIMKATGEDVSTYYPGITSISKIKYMDAVKVCMDILGYKPYVDVNGGYPFGYSKIAAKIELNDGIKLNAGDYATLGVFCKLLYNSIDTNMMTVEYVTKENAVYNIDTVTFGEQILKVGYVEGQLTSYDEAGFCGEAGGNLKINGVNYNYSGLDAGAYYGYYVKAYYQKVNGIDCVKHITIDSRRYSITKISADDIISFNNGKLFWRQENGKKTSKAIPNDALVIENGALITSYTGDIFNITTGEIDLISKNGSNVDTVIIKDYYDFVVNYMDSTALKIYNEINLDENSLCLDLSDNNKKSIIIKDKDGALLEFGNIAVGDTLSVADSDKRTEIIVSKEKLTKCTVDSIEESEDRAYIYTQEQKLKVGRTWLNYNGGLLPALGETVTIYLNVFGEISYISSSNAPMIGYLMESGLKRGLPGGLEIKMMTQDGEIKVFETKPKIKFTSSDGKEKRLECDELYKIIERYTGVVSYDVSDDGFINKLRIPLEEKPNTFDSGTLYKNFASSSANYKNWQKFFQGEVFINNNTKIFMIPDDTEDEDGYALLSVSDLVNDVQYDMESYSVTENDLYADCIVINGDSLSKKTDFFVVSEIWHAIDKNDNEVIELRGYLNGTEVKYQVLDEGSNSVLHKATSIFDSTNFYTVEEGDIIRVIKNPATGFVVSIDILYKDSIENPSSPYGRNGFIVGALGNAPQTGNKGNPALIQGTSVNDPLSTTSSGHRYFYGWVNRKYGNYIEITNQDLGYEAFVRSNDFAIEKHAVNVFPSAMTITYDEYGEITAKSGSSIKSYDTVGSDCSRVLVITKSKGDPVQIFVLNNY